MGILEAFFWRKWNGLRVKGGRSILANEDRILINAPNFKKSIYSDSNKGLPGFLE
jgi:hypothetical protein